MLSHTAYVCMAHAPKGHTVVRMCVGAYVGAV